jgi:hypothetical protein
MRAHPDWCSRAESVDQDEHVSETLSAAAENDVIDIRLRKSQAADDERFTTIEIEFEDCGEVRTYPLVIDQAKLLADAMGRLLP